MARRASTPSTPSTIAFYEIKLTAVSRVQRFYLRDEHKPNTIAGARRYPSLQAAETDLQRIVNSSQYRIMGYGTIGVN